MMAVIILSDVPKIDEGAPGIEMVIKTTGNQFDPTSGAHQLGWAAYRYLEEHLRQLNPPTGTSPSAEETRQSADMDCHL